MLSKRRRRRRRRRELLADREEHCTGYGRRLVPSGIIGRRRAQKL